MLKLATICRWSSNFGVVFAAVMAVYWSFFMVVMLILTALVAPTQPLFNPQPAAAWPHSEAARLRHPISTAGAAVESGNMLVSRFRRLFQHGDEFVCNAQLKCQRNHHNNNVTTSSEDTDRSQTRAILDNYRLPPKLHSAHLQSDRMVPTGPNPLHNSNRSQVIFP